MIDTVDDRRPRRRWIRRVLLGLLFAVPLLPNFGNAFTTYDLPKWALLVAGTLVALLLALARAVGSKEKTRLVMPEHLSFAAVLVVVGFVLAKRAPDDTATVRTLASIGTLVSFALLCSRYLVEGRDPRRAFTALLAAGAAAAVVGIVQSIGGARAGPTSTFGNPSFTAEFAAGALPLAYAVYVLGRRGTGLVAGLLLLAVLILAKSRADLLAVLVAAAVLFFFEVMRRRHWRIPAFAPTAVVLAGILALPWVVDSLPFLQLGRTDTIRIRTHIRESTIEMAGDHTLAGVGLGGFAAAYPAYRHPEEARLSLRREVSFPHDLPLSVLAETGVPGLLFLLFFLWVTIHSGVRTLLLRPDDVIALGALGGAVAILVSAQFSAPLRHPASGVLFFLLAALLVARRPRRYVTDLTGRYRHAVPVLVLLAPVVVAAVLLPRHLRADRLYQAAYSRLVERGGEIDEATAGDLARSIAVEPSPNALRMLAGYRSLTGRPDEALALLETLFTIRPEDPAGRVERARARLMRGETEKAFADLDAVEAFLGDDPAVLQLRALAFAAEGHTRQAFEAAVAALAGAPEDSKGRYARTLDEILDLDAIDILTPTPKDRIRVMRLLGDAGHHVADLLVAAILSEAGEYDAAMALLRGLAERGLLNREALAADERFRALRERHDFRALVEGR